MKRRVKHDKGFLISLGLNMVLRFEWPILAIILYCFHLWLNLPIYFVYAMLIIWVLSSLVITILLFAVSNIDCEMTPERPNKKSMSVSEAQEYFKKNK